MTKVTDRILADIVDTVVKSVDPEQVYVFGSHARGEAGENSDLDLLIVEREGFGPTRSRRREMARIWRLLAPFRIPKDILVYSVDEVQRWRDGRNHVISHALREGKLLYERP
ncbi:MAG: nucleotidyltransferase domain-containing protein [Armatimonadetes bacterium]|nr:nucleotidyltransferase domain-containing protein [Armatimonadota bacterium]